MNLSPELLLQSGLFMDACGILGLGLLGLAAVKLSLRYHSWGGNMMALGAISLLAARLYLLISPYFIDDDFLHAIGPFGITLTYALPPLLLTFGLAGIVWGLWGHERWLHDDPS